MCIQRPHRFVPSLINVDFDEIWLICVNINDDDNFSEDDKLIKTLTTVARKT